MVGCNSSRTPVDTESELGDGGDPVCLYMDDPWEPHFSALKRILRLVVLLLDDRLHVTMYFLSTTYSLGPLSVNRHFLVLVQRIKEEKREERMFARGEEYKGQWDQVSILAKDVGFGHEMHYSEEFKAFYGVTPPRDYAVTYSKEEMSHHTFYGVKLLSLYAATIKFTRDDLSESALRRN
ncbi:ribonuclease H-like domain-containing protein [Tanacetum coccineum]